MLDVRDRAAEPAALADAASRVIDQSLKIAQQELELARVELVEKLPVLGTQLVALAAAAALALVGLILVVEAVAWFLARYVWGFTDVWISFVVLAVVVLVPAALIANRALRRARATGPPVPSAAIRQWRSIRSVVRR